MTEQIFVPISGQQFNDSVEAFHHKALPSSRNEDNHIVVLYHKRGFPDQVILRKTIAPGINNVKYEVDQECLKRHLDSSIKKVRRNSHHGAHVRTGAIYRLPHSDLSKEKVTSE